MSGDIFWQVGPVTVYTLGFSLALGFLTATVVAIPHMRRRGIRRQQVLRLMLALMLFSVLGARLAAIVVRWRSVQEGLSGLLAIPPDGLVYYGGVVSALVVLIVACARNGWPFLSITDTLAPAAAMGLTLGLAVPLATDLLHLHWGGPSWLNLLLFTVAYGGTYLLWRRRDRARFPGELTLLLLGSDSLLRVVLGYLWAYGDAPSHSIRSQAIALLIVAALWFSLRGAAQRRNYRPEGAPTDHPGSRRAPAWVLGYTLLAGLILMRLYTV